MRPQGFLLTVLVSLNGRKRYHLPFVRLYAHEIAAEVVLVESLHDDDNRSVTAVHTVSDGAFKAEVYFLAQVIRKRILWLDRVINDDGTRKLAIVVGDELIEGLLFVLLVLRIHLASTEARHLPACTRSI